VAGAFLLSVKEQTINSIFQGNQASNGGAIGNLGNSLTIVNSGVRHKATGNGGNPGNGGNGGGIYIDGANNTVNLDGIKLSITKAPHMVAAYSVLPTAAR